MAAAWAQVGDVLEANQTHPAPASSHSRSRSSGTTGRLQPLAGRAIPESARADEPGARAASCRRRVGAGDHEGARRGERDAARARRADDAPADRGRATRLMRALPFDARVRPDNLMARVNRARFGPRRRKHVRPVRSHWTT